MFDPERAARQLNSYEELLKSNPDAREVTQGMPLVRDLRNALLQEIVRNGFAAVSSNGVWHVRLPEEGE
jgi:hypothetical protein